MAPESMTRDEFDQIAVRNESANTITYDLRPFDDDQQGAAELLLGELNVRRSFNVLNTSKELHLVVDEKYESTHQIEDVADQLRGAGLTVAIEQ